MEDKIISALVGLVGACNNNTKTPNTDSVVIKTLAFPLLCPEYTAADLRETIDSICAEKNVIAPDCAQCQMPCGNTSDYDMGRIYDAEDAVRKAKLQILAVLQKLAEYACRQPDNVPFDIEFFYKGLAYVSYDLDEAVLLELLNEAEAMEREIRRDAE